jgi:hypothetical protein
LQQLGATIVAVLHQFRAGYLKEALDDMEDKVIRLLETWNGAYLAMTEQEGKKKKRPEI